MDMGSNNETDSDFVRQAFVTIERFSETSGVPIGVVRGWCNRGYLKVIKLGKHLLIDTVELRKRNK